MFAHTTAKTACLALSLLLLACNKGGEKSANADPSTGAEQAGSVACGAATCSNGQVCCNPSCGTCTDPGGMCSQQFCDELKGDAAVGEPPPEGTTTCDNVRCAGGTHCEMVEVQCIKAPCPPVPECRSDAADAGTLVDGGRGPR